MTGEMTDRQRAYIINLVAKKDISSLHIGQQSFLSNEDNLDRLNKEKASEVIKILIACPWKVSEIVKPVLGESRPEVKPTASEEENTSAVEGFEVEKGRYFIVDPTDNVEKFFKVDKPDDGRWKGYTFVHVQASDDFFPIKDKAHREAILAEIAKDPITAMNEYGIRLGRCGKCGRTLTKKDSRLRGLGPICAGRIRQSHSIELSMEDIQNLMKDIEDE